MSEHNLSSLTMHHIQKELEGSMTPYILEEREMRVTQMDIFLSFDERPIIMGCWSSKRPNVHDGSSTTYVFGLRRQYDDYHAHRFAQGVL